MPAQSDRVKALRAAANPGEIPYISKSRVKKWVTCPESFNYAYLKGYKEPENRYMRRGTVVHEAIEDYYANVAAFVTETGTYPALDALATFLPNPIESNWATVTAPYLTNFLVYEARRLDYCQRRGYEATTFLPVAVEAEEWLEDPLDYGEEAIPWMGYADAIYPAAALPAVEGDDGVVIVDFKTGKTPNPKYRDDGIYLEGEYYAMLFASEWDVAAVAGYYPRNDDLVVSPLSADRRAKIREIVHDMQAVNGENPAHLEIDEQPLCYWAEDGQCAYYDMCQSRWGEPLKHAETTRAMVDDGAADYEIADTLACEINHVRYAKNKLGL